MCLYDLQKAFDSVEYPVLLEKLFDVGVNGKMWRLLKSWYDGGSCRVRMDGMLSENFQVKRGVKQGSVLSPALFLLVMDPLLRQLQASGVGLTVNNSMLEVSFMLTMSELWQQVSNHCSVR